MAFMIEQEKCSVCHMCKTNCPADAIRFKEAKYWIDPEKCVSCGTCVELCHNECISDPDNPATAPAPHAPVDMECDICVIGAGAAGLVAAAKASDLGASVIVLEKNHEVGGSAWYATGFWCHYSKLHQEAGVADKRDRIYETFIKKTEGKVNPKLVRRMLDANCDWVNWMIDEHGFRDDYEFMPDQPIMTSLRKKKVCDWNEDRIDAMIGPGGAGWQMTLKLQKVLEENGGQILFKTSATALKLNSKGEIVGVSASDGGGDVNIRCKAVVVAAGTFSRNKEIMNKMQPLFYDDEGKRPIHIFACSTCTGDGITMCDDIGADIDYVNRRVCMFGPVRSPYPAASFNIGHGAYLDSAGAPYKAEYGLYDVSKLVFEPKRYVWLVTDSTNAKESIEFKMSQGTDANGCNVNKFLARWREALEEETSDGSVVIADSIPELARKLGFDEKTVSDEIARYNASAEAALREPPKPVVMPDFGFEDGFPEVHFDMGPKPKPILQAPFYAVRQQLFHEIAVGGMATDENTNVLKDGKPVPGLYAAGDNIRGPALPGIVAVRYIESVFSAMTSAFNLGYISAEEAVNYVKKA